MELKDGMIVVSPITRDLKNLKKGQEFEVYDVNESVDFKYSFSVNGSDGVRWWCLLEGCAHLNGKNWIIKDQPPIAV